jgi:hypothetical protein
VKRRFAQTSAARGRRTNPRCNAGPRLRWSSAIGMASSPRLAASAAQAAMTKRCRGKCRWFQGPSIPFPSPAKHETKGIDQEPRQLPRRKQCKSGHSGLITTSDKHPGSSQNALSYAAQWTTTSLTRLSDHRLVVHTSSQLTTNVGTIEMRKSVRKAVIHGRSAWTIDQNPSLTASGH